MSLRLTASDKSILNFAHLWMNLVQNSKNFPRNFDNLKPWVANLTVIVRRFLLKCLKLRRDQFNLSVYGPDRPNFERNQKNKIPTSIFVSLHLECRYIHHFMIQYCFFYILHRQYKNIVEVISKFSFYFRTMQKVFL